MAIPEAFERRQRVWAKGGDADVNFRFNSNGVFQIKNTDTGNYHDVWIENSGGSVVLKVASTGEA